MLRVPVPFEMIELTAEETELALKEAMVKKHARLEDDRKKRLAQEAKDNLRKPWTPNELYEYARARATELIRYETGRPDALFEPLDYQRDAITALSLYFTNSPEFEKLDSKKYNTTDLQFSLNKGIWLWSNPGCGKTLMMRMFSRNKKQCYHVAECPKITAGYVKYGDDHISKYNSIIKDSADALNFYQEQIGVCFNDLGTETLQAKHYGTAINVMGTIMLNAYEAKVPFWQRHVTTNLTFDQIKQEYGVRLTDRIKQCYNIIEIKGVSYRK